MKNFTLRNKINEAKAEFLSKGGRLEYWSETLAWTLQDYHGSKGSVLDFTEDDWLVCRDNGLTLYEVLELCNETRFNPDMDSLQEFFSTFPCDMPKEDAIATVEDFYIWFWEKLPKVEEIFGNG